MDETILAVGVRLCVHGQRVSLKTALRARGGAKGKVSTRQDRALGAVLVLLILIIILPGIFLIL